MLINRIFKKNILLESWFLNMKKKAYWYAFSLIFDKLPNFIDWNLNNVMFRTDKICIIFDVVSKIVGSSGLKNNLPYFFVSMKLFLSLNLLNYVLKCRAEIINSAASILRLFLIVCTRRKCEPCKTFSRFFASYCVP